MTIVKRANFIIHYRRLTIADPTVSYRMAGSGWAATLLDRRQFSILQSTTISY
jgi:hypothetical protein